MFLHNDYEHKNCSTPPPLDKPTTIGSTNSTNSSGTPTLSRWCTERGFTSGTYGGIVGVRGTIDGGI